MVVWTQACGDFSINSMNDSRWESQVAATFEAAKTWSA